MFRRFPGSYRTEGHKPEQNTHRNVGISSSSRAQQSGHPHFLSDNELMILLAADDQNAAGLLLERHGLHVFKIALAILKDEGEAQDAVQETFLKLYRTASNFDPSKGSFSAWLFRIASHAALNRKDYLRTHRFYVAVDIGTAEADFSPDAHGAVDHLTHQERLHLVNELFAMLKPAQRRAIELKFFEGLTAEQAAARTGESPSSFENNLYRGLKKLKELTRRHEDSTK